MAFKLKPLADLLKMTQEGKDKVLAPIRAKRVKAQAELKRSELEEKVIGMQAEVQELCTSKDIDFDRVLDLMDEIQLIERRLNQYEEVLDQLFPNKSE